MSRWSEKNRCSYCHELGHNRRTCPKVAVDAANPENWNTWRAKQILDRNAATKHSGHRCTYCATAGHTTRTCGQKAIDSADLRTATAAWREQFVNDCVTLGVGPGALISRHGKLFLLRTIEPSRIEFNSYYPFASGPADRFSIDLYPIAEMHFQNNWNKSVLLSGIEGLTRETVLSWFPAGWLSAADIPAEKTSTLARNKIDNIASVLRRI